MGYKVLTGFSQGVWDLLTATGFSFGILVGGFRLRGLMVYCLWLWVWGLDLRFWGMGLQLKRRRVWGFGGFRGFGNGQRRIQRSSVNLNEAT